MGQTIKKVYVGTNQVRPPETKLMSLSDIDEQAEFEAQTIIPSARLVTVTGSNPVQYGCNSYTRYWGGQTKTDITFPTKGEMFLDCIFGGHNTNSESGLWLYFSDSGVLGPQQGTLTVSTSQPRFVYPGGSVNPTPVDFMDGGRHTFKVAWNGGTYNARIDSTQILNNVSGVNESGSTFRFVIFGGAQNGIIRKSIYDFYVKDLS